MMFLHSDKKHGVQYWNSIRATHGKLQVRHAGHRRPGRVQDAHRYSRVVHQRKSHTGIDD
uniref:Uncharacterized protein n=1 Tax=Setaria italica TaxID=4555 RepID=K3YBJ5_SETIT